MKINLRHLAALGATALAFCLSANAQNFTNNTGGSYTASCGGTIKMKSTTATFNGTDQIGVSDAKRISGTVEWAAGSGSQTVQALYYVNLLLSGNSTKSIGDVHVGGTNSCAQSYVAAGGDRTYTGTFYYDGNQPQTILAEGTAAGTYKNLDLSGVGAKTTSGTTVVNGTFATAGTTVNVNNSLTYTGVGTIAGTTAIGNGGTLATTGTAATSATGAITVADGGALSLSSTGVFDITSTGSLTLASGASNFALGSGANFLLNGAFTNNNATSTNLGFDCASNFEYSGDGASQTLVASTAANKYGNLKFSGAATKTANGSVYVCGTSTIAGGYVDMGTTYVYDQNVKATSSGISYTATDNSEYIKGKVNLSGLSVVTDTSVFYTMNNANTGVKFKTVPTTFQLDVLPATTPTKGLFAVATDVNRLVEMSFTGAGYLNDLRVGYTAAEFTGTDADLRFVEGFSTGVAAQKLVGGSGKAKAGTAPTRYVDLDSRGGIELIAAAGGGTTSQISNSSQILMTSTPNIFYAVNPGRWTNPNTWDEGSLPSASDNAEIRTYVYAGITGGAFGTGAANNTDKESDKYLGGVAVANSITIADGATYHNAALIIGNEDNSPGYVFHTTTSATTVGGVNSGFVNNNTRPLGTDWSGLTYTKSTTPSYGTSTEVNGLFIVDKAKLSRTTETSIFGTATIVNNGSIFNHEGTIEVSE